MYNILDKIFIDNKYTDEKIQEDITFYKKEGIEYYFTAKYNKEEFSNFFEVDKTNDIIQQFDLYKKEDENIKKNTSMIIYVEVDDIESFHSEKKSLIFRIEEDEYFFRKYVIIYTKDAIKNIDPYDNINSKIHQILSANSKIDSFQKNNYSDSEYFVAMQLIIKLPFLSLKTDDDEFEPINQKIDSLLHKENLSENNCALINFINELYDNFEDPNDYLDNLKASFLSPDDNDKTLTYFFNQLEELNHED